MAGAVLRGRSPPGILVHHLPKRLSLKAAPVTGRADGQVNCPALRHERWIVRVGEIGNRRRGGETDGKGRQQERETLHRTIFFRSSAILCPGASGASSFTKCPCGSKT